MSNTVKNLVQQGLTAARVGDAEEARRLLTRATQQTPENIEAWLGLAGVVDALAYKQKCFTKVLELDPGNEDAAAGLRLIEEKLAAKNRPVSRDEEEVKVVIEGGIGKCYRHPEVETGLRCNKCNKYICTRCAVRTPVGFRCPDCIREQEDKYYSGNNLDYIIAAVIALPLSLVAAGLFTFILGRIGWFFIILIVGIFVAPAIAGFIAEAVRWGVGKRRSRYLRHIVAGSLILGTAPFLLLGLFTGGLWGIILPGMLIFLGWATISARLR